MVAGSGGLRRRGFYFYFSIKIYLFISFNIYLCWIMDYQVRVGRGLTTGDRRSASCSFGKYLDIQVTALNHGMPFFSFLLELN